MHTKKTIAALSLFSMLSLSAVPAFAASNDGSLRVGTKTDITHVVLNDIDHHWAVKFIKDLVDKGILQGDENHRFNPDRHVTREQFAAMVARTFHLKNTSTTRDFNDVGKDRWSFGEIEATRNYFDAYADWNGGYDFHPAMDARREDVTVTLVKVLMKQNPSITLPDAAAADQLLQSRFKDADSIAAALRPYVAAAVQNHLIEGDDQSRFRPDKPLTRAEAATLLDRLLDNNVVVTDFGGTGGTVTGSTYGTGSN